MELQRGTLGKTIKRARLNKNMTQDDLAERINITSAHMKQLESERRKPSVKVLYKLAYALDLSLDAMLHYSSEDSQDLRNKISVCLDRCSVHEQQVVYATLEAILNKDEPEAQDDLENDEQETLKAILKNDEPEAQDEV